LVLGVERINTLDIAFQGTVVVDSRTVMAHARLEPREFDMDITSPFFVVPVLAVVFLGCILFASLTGKEKDSHH
jgi:hypothetical protein